MRRYFLLVKKELYIWYLEIFSFLFHIQLWNLNHAVVVLVNKSCSTLLEPLDCSRQAPLSMQLPGKSGWICPFLLRIFHHWGSNLHLFLGRWILHWVTKPKPCVVKVIFQGKKTTASQDHTLWTVVEMSPSLETGLRG